MSARPLRRLAPALLHCTIALLASCATVESAAGPREYRDAGFALSLPPNWIVGVRAPGRITFEGPGAGAAVTVADETPPLDVMARVLRERGPADGWEDLQAMETELAGRPALRVTFEFLGDHGLPERTLMYVVNAEGRHYTLMFRAAEASFDEAAFDRIAATFAPL